MDLSSGLKGGTKSHLSGASLLAKYSTPVSGLSLTGSSLSQSTPSDRQSASLLLGSLQSAPPKKVKPDETLGKSSTLGSPLRTLQLQSKVGSNLLLKSSTLSSNLSTKSLLTGGLSSSLLLTSGSLGTKPGTPPTATPQRQDTGGLRTSQIRPVPAALTQKLNLGTDAATSLRKQTKVEARSKTRDHNLKKPKRGKKAIGSKDEDSIYSEDTIDMPEYSFGLGYEDRVLEIPKFIPPEKDVAVQQLSRPLHDVQAMKRTLINAVSASLIRAPDFKQCHDPVRLDLIHMAETLAFYDGEFILKLALYTRCELNIRTTGNFLLAFASYDKCCRGYLRKYFCAAVNLPSDWIDVAEQYQAFDDKNINFGSLPAALRRAMVLKFPDFDKYQLAKYNKDSSGKKKKKKKQLKKKGEGDADKDEDDAHGAGRKRGQVSMRGRPPPGGRKITFVSFEETGARQVVSYSDESGSDSESEEDETAVKRQISALSEQSETEEERRRLSFTLKQLIRKLHIMEPVEHVMCLIGKRYPATLEEFYQSRLPGTFEEERAGKRMKLPTPETWETQVSMKGNKASTWESLIDHKKLPFMAMLRNLRNMIKAGISAKHHTWVLKKLTDEGAVTHSRQFPFRFFSAYEVLVGLERDYQENQESIVEAAVARAAGTPPARGSGRGRGRGRGRGGRGGGRGGKAGQDPNKLPDEVPYDTQLLQRYRRALDTSVKIATIHNVKPIRGSTVIFCNMSDSMSRPCTSARGLGRPRQVCEVGALLGLMCKYSSEDCVLTVYGSKSRHQVALEKGTVLDNMERVLALRPMVNKEREPLNFAVGSLGEEYEESLLQNEKLGAEQIGDELHTMLKDRKQIDNLIILSGKRKVDSAESLVLLPFLRKYRRFINPNLLYVNVDLGGASCGFGSEIHPEDDNDIYIAGYSDQILRFIAERGDGGQLVHVENMDQVPRYKLKSLPQSALQSERGGKATPAPQRPLPVVSFKPRWRTARVFISSTFRDMHGERDLLTRFVFPELRARAHKHFVNVLEVDLRWGLTEEETKSNKTLELCLSEVARCQLFVGILGERYGWVPEKYMVPDRPEFDWVREYPTGASVTELEMYLAALSDPSKAQDKAFFFTRDSDFERNIPKVWKEDFVSENEHSRQQLSKLKQRIKSSGLETYDSYPCWWGGAVGGKPMVAGLEDFGTRVLNNLWLAIQKLYPDEDAMLDEFGHETAQHEAFMSTRREQFVGRKGLLKDAVHHLRDLGSGVIVLAGKPGTGKSALMASLVHEYVESKHCDSGLHVLVHFLGAAPGSTNIVATLRRLCHELNSRFSLGLDVPQDYKNLVPKLEEMLAESAKQCSSPLVVFLDGLDLLDDVHQARLLQWLPQTMPENVILVASTQVDSETHKAVMRHKPTVVQVGALDMWDKAEVVRKTLATHRKQLDESPFNNQMKLLLAKKEANIPLYLSLACEELRVFGVFEKIMGKLKGLPHTVAQLLQEVLVRLEEDLGQELVATSLSLLVCSRSGLSESELHSLLSYHQVLGRQRFTMEDVHNVRLKAEDVLPQGIFARLLRALHGFLRPTAAESTGHLSLAHADIAQAIRQRYLRGKTLDHEMGLHQLVAGYFWSQADPTNDGTWQGRDIRAFSELPYHITCGGCYKDLEETLCNLQFLQTKCQLGMAGQLLADFQARGQTTKTAERERNKFLAKTRVQEYLTFISRNVHILASQPALTWQQAVNESRDSAPARDIQHLLLDNSFSPDISLVEWINKPATADPCVFTISNLSQVVTCVAVSPDSQHFACGSKDCVVRLYELDTGKEVRTFTGHCNQVTDVCFAGTTRLCSASADNTASLWDVQGGHRVSILKGHTRQVNSVTADREGKTIVSAGWDCSLKVWGAKDGHLVCDLKGEQKPVNCVAFHPEGQQIVTGSWDSAIRIWDTFHQVRKAVLRGHTSSVRDVAFSPSGNHIASASLDGDLKLWSAANGAQVGNLRGHGLPINRLTFSPSGHELITVSDDNKVKVWSGHLGKPVAHLGEEEDGPVMSVAIHPAGESVAVGYHAGTVRVYDVISGLQEYEVQTHSASVRCLQYNKHPYSMYSVPDRDIGSMLLTGSDDCSVKLLDASTGQVEAVFSGHTQPVMSVLLGEFYIVSTSKDFTACVYSKPDNLGQRPGMKMKKPSKGCPETAVFQPDYILKGHTGPVTSCSMNSDSTMLVTASRDMSLMFWDMTALSSNMTKEISPTQTVSSCHSDWINCCAWSNTADFVVTSSNDFNLKLWDVKTGKEKTKFTGHMSAIDSVAYSHGCIVSCSFDGIVKVWSHKGSEITTLHGHTQGVNCCDILVKVKVKEQVTESDDWATMVEEEEWKVQHDKTKLEKKDVTVQEVLVASCSDDGTIRLWQPLQGNELACLTGHSDRVTTVACARNATICTSALDSSVKLWKPHLQPDEGTAIATVGSHNAEITCVASSRDGKLVLSSSRDGCVKLWHYTETETGHTLQCARSYTAHSESVNTVCFTGSAEFATGSNDSTVTLWKVVHTPHGLVIRKRVVISAGNPVLTMTYCEVEGQRLLYTGHMGQGKHCEGRRKLWDLSTGEMLSYQDVHTDWVLASTVTGHGPSARVVTGGTDQAIVSVTVITNTSMRSVNIPYHGYEDLPPEKRRANWITALTPTDTGVLAADIHGQLSSVTRSGLRTFTKKLHAVGITCCVQTPEATFTASLDRTIKVWDTSSMQQIGQFYCQSPVSSMTSVRVGGARHLICGDKLGEVTVLQWRGGAKK